MSAALTRPTSTSSLAPGRGSAALGTVLPRSAPLRRTPPVGTRLRLSVERVLADVAAPGAPGELTAGLAWTAALGETCRIAGPVSDVRRALVAFDAGDEPAARTALVDALDALSRR